MYYVEYRFPTALVSFRLFGDYSSCDDMTLCGTERKQAPLLCCLAASNESSAVSEADLAAASASVAAPFPLLALLLLRPVPRPPLRPAAAGGWCASLSDATDHCCSPTDGQGERRDDTGILALTLL